MESSDDNSKLLSNPFEPIFEIETITIKLDKINHSCKYLVILVHNKEGHGFKNIDMV